MKPRILNFSLTTRPSSGSGADCLRSCRGRAIHHRRLLVAPLTEHGADDGRKNQATSHQDVPPAALPTKLAREAKGWPHSIKEEQARRAPGGFWPAVRRPPRGPDNPRPCGPGQGQGGLVGETVPQMDPAITGTCMVRPGDSGALTETIRRPSSARSNAGFWYDAGPPSLSAEHDPVRRPPLRFQVLLFACGDAAGGTGRGRERPSPAGRAAPRALRRSR